MPTVSSMQGYINHRDRQRERILARAETLFVARGISAVNISDIATASDVTRATIYRYFANRCEIAWTILQRYNAEMRAVMPAAMLDPRLSVAARLELWCGAMRTNFFAYPQYVHFRRQFEDIYANTAELMQLDNADQQIDCFAPLYEILKDGQRTGVLPASQNIMQVCTTIRVMMQGFEQHLLLQLRMPDSENSVVMQEMYTEFCNIIVNGLKNI